MSRMGLDLEPSRSSRKDVEHLVFENQVFYQLSAEAAVVCALNVTEPRSDLKMKRRLQYFPDQGLAVRFCGVCQW